MRTLEVGQTTRAEAFKKIPGLKQETVPGTQLPVRCDGDECLEFVIEGSRLSNVAFRFLRWTDTQWVRSALQWWGLRYWRFGVYVTLRSGNVLQYGYGLMTSESWLWYPGAIFIDVSSRAHLAARGSSPIDDDSPEYRIDHYFKWPELATKIAFTPDAPATLREHALRPHLGCVWSIAGCRVANQILPEAEQDRLRIEAAMESRLRSSDQCPARILARRAKDSGDILLVEVKKIGNECPNEYPPTRVRAVDFELVRVLKGKLDRPLKIVAVYRDMNAPWWRESDELVHNSAYDLFRPGQRFLLFSDVSTNIDSPCEAIAADESAVKQVEDNLHRKPQ